MERLAMKSAYRFRIDFRPKIDDEEDFNSTLTKLQSDFDLSTIYLLSIYYSYVILYLTHIKQYVKSMQHTVCRILYFRGLKSEPI